MQPPQDQNPFNQPPPLSNPTGNPYMPPPYQGQNDSGTGQTAQLPPELRGVNWGAFFLNWIWSIAHSSWIGLLALVPYVGIIMCFILLFKGNEWAWQNRRWSSIQEFRDVQQKWMMWGIAIFVLTCVCYGGATLLFLGSGARTNSGSNFGNPPVTIR